MLDCVMFLCAMTVESLTSISGIFGILFTPLSCLDICGLYLFCGHSVTDL